MKKLALIVGLLLASPVVALASGPYFSPQYGCPAGYFPQQVVQPNGTMAMNCFPYSQTYGRSYQGAPTFNLQIGPGFVPRGAYDYGGNRWRHEEHERWEHRGYGGRDRD